LSESISELGSSSIWELNAARSVRLVQIGPARVWGLFVVLRFTRKRGLKVYGGVGHAHSSPVAASGISQLNAAIAAVHSSSLAAFLARKLMPNVPNFSALPAWGASLKTSLRQVISNPTKPAATTVTSSSASSRAPAIHPVQSSILRLALSGTAFCTRISPICSRPLGLSTRAISSSAAPFSGIKLSTPLEITTSAHL
jgi:hypothetical protein